MSPVQSRRLTQEVEDTYRRALNGGVFYLIAWLVVGTYGGAFARVPAVSWTLVLVFVCLAIARIVRRPPRDAEFSSQLAWLWIHWGIVVTTTTTWGVARRVSTALAK